MESQLRLPLRKPRGPLSRQLRLLTMIRFDSSMPLDNRKCQRRLLPRKRGKPLPPAANMAALAVIRFDGLGPMNYQPERRDPFPRRGIGRCHRRRYIYQNLLFRVTDLARDTHCRLSVLEEVLRLLPLMAGLPNMAALPNGIRHQLPLRRSLPVRLRGQASRRLRRRRRPHLLV